MKKLAIVPTLYDGSIDETREATQQDVDDLVEVSTRLFRLRQDLLRVMTAYFPTIAEDIEFGSALRGRLNRDFYRANDRHPTAAERRIEFAKFEAAP